MENEVTQDILSNTSDADAYKISIQFSGESAITTDQQQKITDSLIEKSKPYNEQDENEKNFLETLFEKSKGKFI